MKVEMICTSTVLIAANLKNKRSQRPSFLVNISSCPKMHQLTKFNDLRPNFAQI